MRRSIYLSLVVAVWAVLPVLAQSLTLREAYEVALPAALEWNPKAGLYAAHSADWGKEDPNEGIDGKRYRWYIRFSFPEVVGLRNDKNKDAESVLFVEVIDGKVADTFATKDSVFWSLIPAEEIPDTALIANTATKAGIKPSDEFAFGMHFSLYRNEDFYTSGSVMEGIPSGAVYLEVIGRRAPGALPKEVEEAPGAAGLSYMYFAPQGKLLKEVN